MVTSDIALKSGVEQTESYLIYIFVAAIGAAVVGTAVGASVGAAVVGAKVGAAVVVGVEVGAFVGAFVGAAVIGWTGSKFQRLGEAGFSIA